MINQLRKLYNVKKVELLEPDDSINRELMLIKVKNNPNNRQDIMTAVNIFRSKIIDYSSDALCIEITGESTKIDAFVEIMRAYDIIEMCRTGVVALERGSGSILAK